MPQETPDRAPARLELSWVSAGYGAAPVLRDLSLSAAAGEVTCLMGRNGAGKSTLLKTVMGLVPAASGGIRLDGERIDTLAAHLRPRHGIGYVPQGRRLFGEMTVAENLEVGLAVPRRKFLALNLTGRNLSGQNLTGLPAGGRIAPEQGPPGQGLPGLADPGQRAYRGNAPEEDAIGSEAERLRRVLDLFPRLEERLDQTARTLSGGEQQMLAIGRALCLAPRVLLLDEPTEGLQPSMITLIRDALVKLRAEGVAVVLVEQRVEAVLRMADRVVFLVQGQVAETRAVAGLDAADPVFARHVGV